MEADAAGPRAPAARVIYVHGSAPQPATADLKRALDEALFGADQGVRTTVAYFADLLHPNPAAETLGVLAEVIGAIPAELSRDRRAVAEQLAEDVSADEHGGAAFRRRLAQSLTSRMARAGAQDGPRASAAVTRLLPAPIRAFLFRVLVRFLVRDAHAYFFGGLAPTIHERVKPLLGRPGAAVVVIAHSLGSVVAYDVLSEAPSAAVSLLLTVGSPLAIDAVKDQVHQPPAVPSAAGSWLNVSDPLDILAADPTVADEYGSPERIRDVLVFNLARFPHDFAGYLRTTEVREAVARVVSGALART